MNRATYRTFRWSGSDAPHLDAPCMTECGHVSVGCFGGATASGAHKNEDGTLVWAADDGSWTAAALLDAHGSSDSAILVLNRVAELEGEVSRLLNPSYDGDEMKAPPFWNLCQSVVRHLGEETFRQRCVEVRGETALLICVQKGAYLWWLSVGDIPVYVFHPDFARLGQYALNQRMFFEWVGQVNTFALSIPCYSTGVRQLRAGMNRILMTTDGLLECGTHPFETPSVLADLFALRANSDSIADAIEKALTTVRAEQGRDSATLIAWQVEVSPFNMMMQPSA